jgi:hypothetical protein
MLLGKSKANSRRWQEKVTKTWQIPPGGQAGRSRFPEKPGKILVARGGFQLSHAGGCTIFCHCVWQEKIKVNRRPIWN